MKALILQKKTELLEKSLNGVFSSYPDIFKAFSNEAKIYACFEYSKLSRQYNEIQRFHYLFDKCNEFDETSYIVKEMNELNDLDRAFL